MMRKQAITTSAPRRARFDIARPLWVCAVRPALRAMAATETPSPAIMPMSNAHFEQLLSSWFLSFGLVSHQILFFDRFLDVKLTEIVTDNSQVYVESKREGTNVRLIFDRIYIRPPRTARGGRILSPHYAARVSPTWLELQHIALRERVADYPGCRRQSGEAAVHRSASLSPAVHGAMHGMLLQVR